VSEDYKINATKRAIARCLSDTDKGDEELFKCVQKDVGHGRPTYNSVRDQMIGAKEVTRIGPRLGRKRLHLTDLGRQRYLGSKQ